MTRLILILSLSGTCFSQSPILPNVSSIAVTIGLTCTNGGNCTATTEMINPPAISLSRSTGTTFSFTATTQIYSINGYTGTSSVSNWLFVNQQTSFSGSSLTPFNITVDATNVPTGYNTGIVTVTSTTPGLAGYPLIIPVYANVACTGGCGIRATDRDMAPLKQTISTTPPQTTPLTFPYNQTFSQPVVVSAPSGMNVSATVSYAQGQPSGWLSLCLAGACNGSQSFQIPNNLTLSVDPTGLTFGQTYTATINLAAGTLTASFTVYFSVPPIIVYNGANTISQIAPGSIISLFGAGQLAPSTKGQGFGPPLPTNWQGASVTINGLACPFFYVLTSPYNQLELQAPMNLTPGTWPVTVTYNGQVFTAPVTVLTASPGIFTTDFNVLAILQDSNGHLLNQSNPASPGQAVTMYFTGIGPVSNPPATGGSVSNGSSKSTEPYTLTVNGQIATVTYIGLAPYRDRRGSARLQHTYEYAKRKRYPSRFDDRWHSEQDGSD